MVGNLLNIGNNSLRAHQVAINVTGNNIANSNTAGYVRQSVRFEESTPFDYRPGQIGTGAYAHEIYRNFNRYLENNFLSQNGLSNMWNESSTVMQTVQALFNEANTDGIHNQLTEFFDSWSELHIYPESIPVREDIISKAQNLTMLYKNAKQSLADTKKELNDYINLAINDVNDLIDQLSDVNKEIAKSYDPPRNNCNALLDKRDALVRELSTLVDVKVQDRGPRDFKIYLQEGMPLLEDQTKYYLSTQGPFYENDCKNFTGELHFEGSSAYEYTMEFVSATEFKVSIDNGKSWITDSKGNNTFTVPPVGQKLDLGEITVSFSGEGLDDGDIPYFDVNDKFYIVPKDSVMWHKPTRDPINVSKSVDMEALGGKLGAYCQVRDGNIGKYEAQLDALAESLIWEVNRIHSQGAGLDGFNQIIGTTYIKDTGLPLGSDWQNYAFHDRLTEGNTNIYFYNEKTGEPLLSGSLNFNFTGVGDPENFDPSKHSLQDVAAAINNSYIDAGGNPLITATIEGGVLQLTAADGVEFKMGADTTGIWAALGVNTFFVGENSSDIAINPYLVEHPEYINAASIDGQTEGNVGDGVIAQRISKLAEASVKIHTPWETREESLLSYYAGIVGGVGADTRNANFNADYYGTLADEADTQAQGVSGVNLDEELTLLIRYQHSYTAAAKLITTADQMFETLLGMKQ